MSLSSDCTILLKISGVTSEMGLHRFYYSVIFIQTVYIKFRLIKIAMQVPLLYNTRREFCQKNYSEYKVRLWLRRNFMANQIKWRDEFNIGISSIDKEHQQLFKIINKLFVFREEEKDSRWLCQEGIKFFRGHVSKHFSNEEAYMASIGYDGLEQHAQIHKNFRENTLPVLEAELEESSYGAEAVDHFLGVCTGWLIGHTLTEDIAITGRRKIRWEKLLPEEELDAVKKIITQLVFDMFHLESQLISDTYGGEKFGSGVYYRLIYGKKNEKKKQEIFLVFEEKLLINTIGKVLGIQTNRLDSMLVNAARYTARQFVGRVIEHFPAMEGYELQAENLLTYEQFRSVLRKGKMQASLLFNTGGAGYFAYCIIAPHLLEDGVGTPIIADNVLAEVEEYLEKREEQKTEEEHKPKVLVVDDSKTIRYFMRDLLSPDYEVTLAESGIAAIRTITLNRPDLVLLDYEMPVCDGSQTLEMLRSEEAFANLPVIFLTGRRDTESVKKVITLKPEGYLLKDMEPEVIRQEVDNFFRKKKG